MSRRDATTTKVFVGSLPAEASEEELRKLFEPYGKIVECDIANRCGFLHLQDKDLALKAIEELNNKSFMGSRISVEKGRVKPPNRDRNRSGGPGGPMRGGRDRGAPYDRDDGYGRGPPRNGMGGGYGERDYPSYGGDRFSDYGRGLPPIRSGYGADYDRGIDSRSSYDDRRDYMGERRPYGGSNGYGAERRPYEDRPYPSSGSFDDRRLSGGVGGPTSSVGYEERRTLLGERRPLLDSQGSGGVRPLLAGGYEREMFSRRGDTKPGGGGLSGSGYGSGDAQGGSYSGASTGGGYGASSGYGSSAPGGGGYGGGYSDSRGASSGFGSSGGGYGISRGGMGSGYTGGGGGDYGASSGGGFNNSYGTSRGGGYDSSFSSQRSFSSGGGGPSGPGRRF